MINSLFGDGTRSWVMIVSGVNECVTEMTEGTQENHIDDVGDSTETCCQSKTETNTNADDFCSHGHVTISPA